MLALAALVFAAAVAGEGSLPDDEIRNRLIHDSIMAHDGPCACPYNLGSDRKPCGDRSAYRRRSAKSRPICFAGDVTPRMIREFREGSPLRGPSR